MCMWCVLDSVCVLNIKYVFQNYQAEIADTQRESKNLQFKEEVLKKEKQMLKRFADHVSQIHSVDVCTVLSQCHC